MNGMLIAIRGIGLVSAVGLHTEACCAAFRAKVNNPVPSRFLGPGGEWILTQEVPLRPAWRGLQRLAVMAATAIEQALQDLPRTEWAGMPLLLCVAEKERPGRLHGLDEQLFGMVQQQLGVSFGTHSAVITQGRVSVAVAMARARALMAQGECRQVLVAAADSLLTAPTLAHFAAEGRLLTPLNANGFIPGEGGGALWLTPAGQAPDELVCAGIGFGMEPAHVTSDEPLKAEGLVQAIRAALDDAGAQMHDLDFRITDLSGEQYYFKEATLALSRLLRQRKEMFDIWHPAECMGEAGAAIGAAVMADASLACRKGYAPGPRILAHFSNDTGQRAAVCLSYRGAA